jgi:hypothetical protein
LKFKVKEWNLQQLYIKRNQINFPVYQRQEVWSEGKKALLIDSIFRGIDIPKLYLQKNINQEGEEQWDCIDGHQRIMAIWGFFDGDLEYEGDTFDQLTVDRKTEFEEFPLTIVEVTEISDEDVRLLFHRLQLGVPLNSGENLNAILSNMGKFVKEMVECPFIQRTNLPTRRFAKEQVCAQICNNSSFINKTGVFKNSKYEDLEVLYVTNKEFSLQSKEANNILNVLGKLDEIFGFTAGEITNRASVVSIYLLVEEMFVNGSLNGHENELRDFYTKFLGRLREEVRLGIDAKSHYLVGYQGKIIQAADSRSSIEFRHMRLKEAFEYYLSSREIKQ